MDQVLDNLTRYLKETLDIDVQPGKWQDTRNLPIFLRNMYDFSVVNILGKQCLIMAVKEETEQTPATVRKHMLQVGKKWNEEIIYLQHKVTAYNRKRLIQQKIPFIVPLNQMYLPFLGIDLREHFRKLRKTEIGFSPSTQVVVLDYLINNSRHRMTPNILAKRLGYSVMTMSRAFDELEAAGLVSVAMEGRERVLCFDTDKRQTWERALERMYSPVKKRFWVKSLANTLPGIKAGLSALSCYSNLSEPANLVIALEGKQWKQVKADNDITILNMAESHVTQLEIWSYSPALFEKEGVVDRFSLFLSMKENNDERIQSALEKMMEQVEW